MEESSESLRLYSISAAAKQMCISRESIRSFLNTGKLGYIIIGRSTKISHQEILKFQTENTIRTNIGIQSKTIDEKEIESMFFGNKKNNIKTLSGDKILQNIIKDETNGNCKKKR